MSTIVATPDGDGMYILTGAGHVEITMKEVEAMGEKMDGKTPDECRKLFAKLVRMKVRKEVKQKYYPRDRVQFYIAPWLTPEGSLEPVFTGTVLKAIFDRELGFWYYKISCDQYDRPMAILESEVVDFE